VKNFERSAISKVAPWSSFVLSHFVYPQAKMVPRESAAFYVSLEVWRLK